MNDPKTGRQIVIDLTPPHKDRTSGVHGAGSGIVITSSAMVDYATTASMTSLVAKSLYTGKGVILSGSAANAPVAITAGGTTGYVLTCDTSLSSNAKWAAAGTAGGGDMLKSTYDSNLDGVFELAQLSGSVATTANIATHAALTSVHSLNTYASTASVAAKLANVVEDTTPQLGGSLYTNNQVVYFDNGAGTTVGAIYNTGTANIRIGTNAPHGIELISGSSISMTAAASCNINLSTSAGGKAYYNGVEIGSASGFVTNPLTASLDASGWDLKWVTGTTYIGQIYPVGTSGIKTYSDNAIAMSAVSGVVNIFGGAGVSITAGAGQNINLTAGSSVTISATARIDMAAPSINVTASNALVLSSSAGYNLTVNAIGGGSVQIANMATAMNEVSASRAAMTSYQNTTGTPLEVVVIGAFNAVGDFITLFAGSATAPTADVASFYWASTALSYGSATKIIPCNWYYRYALSGSATLYKFWETKLGQ